MKKKALLLLLAIMVVGVSQTWAIDYQTFSATYTQNGPFTYDGSPKEGITVNGSNCTYEVTGNLATNAGNYTAHIGSKCDGHHEYMSGDWEVRWYHVGSLNVNWVINPRDLIDGVTINVTDQQWTGNPFDVAQGTVYTIQYNSTDLVKGTDFDVYVTDSKEQNTLVVKNEGRYTIVFEGKGNFTGTVTKTFDVKKDMSKAENLTGVHYDIPEQVLISGETYDFKVNVTDTKSHAQLYENEHYTMKFYKAEACDASDEVTEAEIQTTGQGKYWVKFTGVAPKYDETTEMKKAFYVVNEYQTYTPSDAELATINMRITKAGYPIAEDSPTKAVVPGEMQVAVQPSTGEAAIDKVNSTKCEIPATMKVTVTEDLNYNIVGIENNAFAGCNKLRWINSLIPEDAYTPSSLDRTIIDTPFYGLPKATLVYLYGTTVKGENYIYKIGTDDYRCETYHVYEDTTGKQQKFSDKIE